MMHVSTHCPAFLEQENDEATRQTLLAQFNHNNVLTNFTCLWEGACYEQMLVYQEHCCSERTITPQTLKVGGYLQAFIKTHLRLFASLFFL
ncbi:MAG: hypothetical protein RI911_418 [Candidatus Parcubacteria bacterium]|jgi:hypothetical protein